MARSTTRQVAKRDAAESDRALARRIGERIRSARHRATLTQQGLAGPRYTKAYISALENGIARPSMVALEYLAARLGVASTSLLDPAPVQGWDHVAADVELASGHWTLALDGYDAILEQSRDHLARAAIQRARAEALARAGRWRDAVVAATEAADVFAARGRAVDAAHAEYWLAESLDGMGATAQASEILARLEAACATGRDLGEDFRVRVLVARAGIALRHGDHAGAIDFLERARSAAVDIDDRARAAYLFELASSYRDAGDVEAAVRVATAARALLEAAGADRDLARCENLLAVAHLAMGNTSEATTHVDMARAASRDRDPWQWAHVAETAAQVAISDGRLGDARALLDDGLRAARSNDNALAEADALITFGRLEAREGNGAAAEANLERGIEMLRELGLPGRVRDALGTWSRIAADRGELRRALELAQEALALG